MVPRPSTPGASADQQVWTVFDHWFRARAQRGATRPNSSSSTRRWDGEESTRFPDATTAGRTCHREKAPPRSTDLGGTGSAGAPKVHPWGSGGHRQYYSAVGRVSSSGRPFEGQTSHAAGGWRSRLAEPSPRASSSPCPVSGEHGTHRTVSPTAGAALPAGAAPRRVGRLPPLPDDAGRAAPGRMPDREHPAPGGSGADARPGRPGCFDDAATRGPSPVGSAVRRALE